MRISQLWLALIPALLSGHALASGSNISKVIHPYVQQTEQELEYELTYQRDDRANFDNQQLHRLEYGHALTDRWMVEFGIVGANLPNSDFDITAWEIEAKLQLSEQGEFNNDWALLFEIEREEDKDIWEIGSSLIVLHEWKRWVGTANLNLSYETGDNIKDEFETALSAQFKYRYKAALEPAIEFFKNQDTNAIGPSLLGQRRLGGRKKLFWETGVAFSLDSSRPDTIFRLNVEFEF